jgi:hypothetical protein
MIRGSADPNHDTAMAPTGAVRSAVVARPIPCGHRGRVNPATIVGRSVRRIITTMPSMAATPLRTSVQDSGLIGSMGQRCSPSPAFANGELRTRVQVML